MRDDQFAEGVKRSLYAVTTRLEQDETKHFLEEDMQNVKPQFYPRANSDGSLDLQYNFTTADGIHYDITQKGNIERHTDNYTSMRDIIRGQYLYQKGLLDEVILNIVNQSSNRPISERADSTTVCSYLKSGKRAENQADAAQREIPPAGGHTARHPRAPHRARHSRADAAENRPVLQRVARRRNPVDRRALDL